MPAAELSRLQAQISAISTQFDHPAQFLRSLISLMELYSDQHLHAGEQSRLRHLHPEYHLPALVTQQLETALHNLTPQNPAAALKTMDALKQEKHFEAKILAAEMLGSYPAKFKSAILERVQAWVQPGEDEFLVDKILDSSSRFFNETNIETWLKQIQKWLQAEDPRLMKIGLHALNTLLDDPAYLKFEIIFPLLEPAFLHPILSSQREALDVLKSLIKRSEMESLAFVRAILNKTHDTDTIRFIRRCIPLFSEDIQTSLIKEIF
jgi:hypothetical protein